jgi:hypothetical protein
MSNQLLEKPIAELKDLEILQTPEKSTLDVIESPQASVCTWCREHMMFDNHCKSREEAANCSNYKPRR